jgi:glycosyltransferase involved in cell wall biosynthesis
VKVLLLSKAFLAREYRKKLTALAAQPGLEITAAGPCHWGRGHERQDYEPGEPDGFQFDFLDCRFNGRFHLHHYPGLGRLLDRRRPDLLHIDEEPYNLAAGFAAMAARRRRIPSLFFAWQNLVRRYPPPFSLIERYCYRACGGAIAGTEQAAQVLRAKGFAGPLATIPQFGIDPDKFASAAGEATADGPLLVGYAGRLVPEKGIATLLRAAATLDPAPKLRFAGTGPLARELRRAGARGPLAGRIEILGHIDSDQMPAFLNSIQVLVLPSLDRSNWLEQFGRVLIEAMACERVVVGSDSGAIPLVVGDAGLIFPQADVGALARVLDRLRSPGLRSRYGKAGRRRALEHFTHFSVAEASADFYARFAPRRGSTSQGDPRPKVDNRGR